MVTKFRKSREEMLDQHERQAMQFVAACGARVVVFILVGSWK